MGKALCAGSSGKDLSFVTAGAGQILEGYTGTDQEGESVEGAIPLSSVLESAGGTIKTFVW